MTPPSTTPTTVDLRAPGDLLAATPQLLGFRPTDSVLVIGHRAPTGTRIGAVLRADLPPPGDEPDLARRLRNPLAHDAV
ncbi:DUF4192 family protein, partial [Saccharomonospora iraqiensis]|uniref:DUF4192 family protein n=1 Tax=Saccharomonospora iraqiensis TaxID=52698 RepID=UPI0005595742